jgi:hypothetical protein
MFIFQVERKVRMVKASFYGGGIIACDTRHLKHTFCQARIDPRSSKHKLQRYLSMFISRNLRVRAPHLQSCLRYSPLIDVSVRTMTTERTKLPHEDRTAREPRNGELHPVILDHIETVNDTIRLFRLGIKDKERGVKVGFPSFELFLNFTSETQVLSFSIYVLSPPCLHVHPLYKLQIFKFPQSKSKARLI